MKNILLECLGFLFWAGGALIGPAIVIGFFWLVIQGVREDVKRGERIDRALELIERTNKD